MILKRVNYRYILVQSKKGYFLVDSYTGLLRTLCFFSNWYVPHVSLHLNEDMYLALKNRKKSWIERFSLTVPTILFLTFLFRYPLSRTKIPAYLYNATSFEVSIVLFILLFCLVMFFTFFCYWNSKRALFNQFPELQKIKHIEYLKIIPVKGKVTNRQLLVFMLLWIFMIALVIFYLIFRNYLFLLFIFSVLFILIPIANSGIYHESASYDIQE